jgi:serpin B
MPRLRFGGSLPLDGALKSLGVRSAFAQEEADFSGMTGSKGLILSHVVHAAYVEMNEGRKRGASEAEREMGLDYESWARSADPPFLLAVVERHLALILLIGEVRDPKGLSVPQMWR